MPERAPGLQPASVETGSVLGDDLPPSIPFRQNVGPRGAAAGINTPTLTLFGLVVRHDRRVSKNPRLRIVQRDRFDVVLAGAQFVEVVRLRVFLAVPQDGD